MDTPGNVVRDLDVGNSDCPFEENEEGGADAAIVLAGDGDPQPTVEPVTEVQLLDCPCA